MFNRLRDSVNRVLGDGVMQWRRVIDAFGLKYPSVHISERFLQNDRGVAVHTPGAYLVWKVGQGSDYIGYFDYSPIPAGAYVVQLFPTRRGAEEHVDRMATGRARRVATSMAEAGKDTVVTDILCFDYDGPVGELTKFTSFYQTVLEEDKKEYVTLANRSREGKGYL
jgi:hypothetical protein